MPEIIKRSMLAEYINVTPGEATADYERIGFGVEGKSTEYSPEIDERQFIDEDSPNSSVKRYNQSSEFDIIAAKDSPVFEYLDTLRVTRATYADAETDECCRHHLSEVRKRGILVQAHTHDAPHPTPPPPSRASLWFVGAV